ncbi:alpha-crystallin domain-containing protein 22.3-like [Solanum dulcamara]|uniref:alpha-crystallin domain-containing protein 22.3-like n=1 Tax=Solanum dulcamara TaxID=45834 RepID=UPI0024855703|nr:alpha-crystallin domain-containing protein 22.3-like [Solanum dulcamara]XP_055816777.1 alpha-crystallin domain-containing protein 22.3-like [Solanum dulcamara]
MESPSRASETCLPNYGENNGSTPLHPEPLNVAPISSVPPLPCGSPDINTGSVPIEADSKHIISSQQHGGPLIGSLDVAESEDNYLFRVSLPGVVRHERVFFCDAGPNGQINIRGVSEIGKNMVRRGTMVFKMQTQNLCTSGEFSISFQLPGPIDHQNVDYVFGSDGIFQGIVKKKKTTGP